MPGSPSTVAPEQTSPLPHPRGHLAAGCLGHAHPEESTSSKISYIDSSDRAWVSWEDFSPVSASTRGLSHGRTRRPGPPGVGGAVFPSELAGGPGTRQAIHAQRASGPRAGFQTSPPRSRVTRARSGGRGPPVPEPQSRGSLSHFSPGFSGSAEGDSSGVQVLCFLLEPPGKALEAHERTRRWADRRVGVGGSTIGRPNQASRQTDEGNNIITPRTPWGRYSKYHIK